MTRPSIQELRKINNELRKLIGTGEWTDPRLAVVMTAGFSTMTIPQRREVIKAIAAYEFDESTLEASHECDFGAVDMFGEQWIWMFTYHPKDGPSIEKHAITIMHESEY